jgi:hypothetical protein
MESRLVRAALIALALSTVSPVIPAASARAATGTMVDGSARFQVLSPALIRLEYTSPLSTLAILRGVSVISQNEPPRPARQAR